jgi:hypothetical protein
MAEVIDYPTGNSPGSRRRRGNPYQDIFDAWIDGAAYPTDDERSRNAREGAWMLFAIVITALSAFGYFSGRATGILCGTSAFAACMMHFLWDLLERIPGLGRVVKLLSRLILPAFMAALYGTGYYLIFSR